MGATALYYVAGILVVLTMAILLMSMLHRKRKKHGLCHTSQGTEQVRYIDMDTVEMPVELIDKINAGSFSVEEDITCIYTDEKIR